jgi:hypothetical protein
MTKPTGGRGNKAPYATKIVRVPEPVLEEVLQIIAAYRDGADREFSATASLEGKPVTSYEVIQDKIDEWRKSSKVGKAKLEKLLQLIYGDDFSI